MRLFSFHGSFSQNGKEVAVEKDLMKSAVMD
jgi:hypothetical protein